MEIVRISHIILLVKQHCMGPSKADLTLKETPEKESLDRRSHARRGEILNGEVKKIYIS